VFLDLSPEQRALRDELRVYFADLVKARAADDLDDEVMGEGWKATIRQMGADGWLGIGWPKEYGGQGRGAIEQLIFLEEAGRAGAPIPLVTLNTVGPTIAQFGTDEQKQRFLPGILAGEIHFAIGYTEPGAGTDLASLRTSAVRDGDEFVVNGQKVFTSGGHEADFVWLACRTDPAAPKHKGISILIVDTDQPGFKWTPINTVAGGFTSATYYEDVRVPASMLVGEENLGWKMITTQLNFERVALGPSGRIFRSLNAVLQWAKETRLADGTRVIDVDWVRTNLARVRAKAEVAELLNWRVAWHRAPSGDGPPAPRGRRHRRLHPRRVARGRARGPARARVPRLDRRHLRRRRQRGPAGDHRHHRPRHAPPAPLGLYRVVDDGPRAEVGIKDVESDVEPRLRPERPRPQRYPRGADADAERPQHGAGAAARRRCARLG